MRTVALCNQKGGVGKSTTTFHLARAAANAGVRTLIIDMDPQGNITQSLSDITEGQVGVADALSARTSETLADVITPTPWSGVDIAPTTGETLGYVRDELVLSGAGREARLKDQITSLPVPYDLVLIDCPPSLDQLTINALSAADGVLIITQSKQWSATGLAHLLETIRSVRAHYNPGLQISSVVINLHDARTVSGTTWLETINEAAAAHEYHVFMPPIPKRVVISDSVEAGLGLDEWPADTAELENIYAALLKEVLQ